MKFVKCSLEFVDFRADVYRNFTKSCGINKIIRYNNFPVRAALPPNRPHAAEVDCLVFKRAASADLISTKVVRLLYASSA